MRLTSFIRSKSVVLLSATVLCGAFAATFGAAQDVDPKAEDYPPVLKVIEQQGLTILGEMQVPGGLRAFAAKAGAQPLALYLTPDGEHVVVGTLVDGSGQDMAEAQLKEMVEAPIKEEGWKKLERSTWVQDGEQNAPRIVYVFTDPNCPYCNQFWTAARPWVETGKVQLRHVMVGVIRQDSPAKAAAILEATSPQDALAENELNYQNGGISPLETVAPDMAAKLEANAALMTELGFAGTPAIVFRKVDGSIGNVAGLPQGAALEMILGPK
ncbi:thiol:disulfide interchange protein DsbG [Ciceribacter selenitireducens]|uniref:thiol:disulfide interchange protein DsbG n=1 Tax=Ciceribacter selenitireducens TaxID=448181 RepID=UPI000E209AE8|nr:thiol:disulfide interchange protein DsbG [Ciceribacter selenitireducens]